MSELKYCFIIPTYNHHKRLKALLTDLSIYQLPFFLIDDGSATETKNEIKILEKQFQNLFVISLKENNGKGYGVILGCQLAFNQGFSHGIQIDADYQHNAKDIKKFIKASQSNIKALISGNPIYDDSIPKSRLYGRKITNFWVIIETLSFKIPEAMCGFRIYPLKETVNLSQKTNLNKRMGFDIEVVVRLYWQNTPVIFIDTPVIYPKGNTSNFRGFKDNLTISLTHTKLFFAMLIRLPKLILNKLSKKI